MLKNLSNSNSTDVAEKIKPVYNTNCSQKNNLKSRIQTSVPKFFAAQEKKEFFSLAKDTQQERKVEKVYRRIPPYLTYIGDSIDQGATRLGGYRSVYMFADGGSPFSLGFIIDTNSRSL